MGEATVQGTRAARVRINVSVSTKGVKTWDHTIDYVDPDGSIEVARLVALAESDILTAELEKRYPLQTD